MHATLATVIDIVAELAKSHTSSAPRANTPAAKSAAVTAVTAAPSFRGFL